MTATRILKWLDEQVSGQIMITFEEEDGGVIMRVVERGTNTKTYLNTTVSGVIEDAIVGKEV